jgi:hypothetical protein
MVSIYYYFQAKSKKYRVAYCVSDWPASSLILCSLEDKARGEDGVVVVIGHDFEVCVSLCGNLPILLSTDVI